MDGAPVAAAVVRRLFLPCSGRPGPFTTMQPIFQRIADSPWFQWTIVGAIVLASGVMGLETEPGIMARFGTLLHAIDALVLGFFIVEAFIKIAACGRQPWRYFQDGWNLFDFLIILLLAMPFQSQFFVLLRMVRLLRVFRLITALPRLRIIVCALIRSFPSIGYVFSIMLVVFYAYGVAATFLFRDNDPVRFGNLLRSVLTLFQVVTLEGWQDVMNTQVYGCDRVGYDGLEELCVNPEAFPLVAPLFFVSFVLVGATVVMNLVVGAIVSSMMTTIAEIHEEEQESLAELLEMERSREHRNGGRLEQQLMELHDRLAQLQGDITHLRQDLRLAATQQQQHEPPPLDPAPRSERSAPGPLVAPSPVSPGPLPSGPEGPPRSP